MTLTLLGLGNASHDLRDVLATARPSCFAALTAANFLAHLLFSLGKLVGDDW
jgi:hypothetical protein